MFFIGIPMSHRGRARYLDEEACVSPAKGGRWVVVPQPAVPPETVSSPVLATSVVGPSVGETRIVVFVMVCLTNKMAETLAAMRCEHPVGHDALVPQVTGSSPWNQFRAIRSVCEG